MGKPDGALANMRILTWVFCLGDADVQGNDLADRVSGRAEIEGRLRMYTEDTEKAVLDRLREHEERNGWTVCIIQRLMKEGQSEGAGRKSEQKERNRIISKQPFDRNSQ